jgi:hypothetical protein
MGLLPRFDLRRSPSRQHAFASGKVKREDLALKDS